MHKSRLTNKATVLIWKLSIEGKGNKTNLTKTEKVNLS